MLQIRLSNPESVVGAKSLPAETVTVACPDHLVLADLPVAKSIGATPAASLIKIVGRRCRRHYGERTHFCVRCDFPVAIYGRLSPCEHAFCLDCARSDSSCYLCDERIQKIQTIKMMEGLFICAAPHCLKSFLKKSEFVSHIQQKHVDLLQPNMEKEDGNQSDALTLTRPSSTDALTKQSSTVDVSTARAPPRIGISPNSNSQYHDLEDKSRRNQPREQQLVKSPMVQPKPPPFYSRPLNYPPEMQENNTTPVLDRPGPYNHFHQQHSSDSQGGLLHRQDSNQFPEKMQGMRAESPFPDYSMHSQPPPGFVVPVNTNQGLAPPFNYSPFPAEGAHPFYNPPYEMARPDMASGVGLEQNSLLGYPTPPSGAMGYPRPWNMGSAGMPFEHIPPGQGVLEGYVNQSDSQGRPAFFQGDFGQAPGMLPLQPPLMPPMAGKVLEPPQGGSASDGKGGKGVLAPEPMSLPPPPPPPPRLSQLPPQGNFSHSGEAGQEEQNYRWQNEADRQ